MGDAFQARAGREEWKPIARYPRYRVSSLGRVSNIETLRDVAIQKCGSGTYRKVALFQDGKRTDETVHQLVLETFAGPRPEGMYCAHINGDGADNRASNLAWVTGSENAYHKANTTSLETRVAIADAAGKVKQTDLAHQFGVSVNTVQRIQREARSSLRPTIAIARGRRA